MSSALARKLDRLEPLVQASAGNAKEVVYGVVESINDDGSPNFARKWIGNIGNMRPTNEDPNIFIAEALEPLILKHKKYKCVFGGRAGTKSIAAMDAMAGDVSSCGSKVFVLRERMKSLKESIYSGIKDRVRELKLGGFTPVPSQWEIRHRTAGGFAFGGMQNIIDMKGSFKFKYFLMEEAARTSQQTLDTLGPTLRNVDGAELWFLWNPESSNDPMSQEFIVPYQAELDRCGYYEDDHHLIIRVNFDQNPWFWSDKSLSQEHLKDKQKVEDGRMSKSRFNHIWLGAFNDDIEDSAIDADWFDACIDAHKKLGFDSAGAIVCGHDPSDTGDDAKGYALRHGVVFRDVREIEAENANRAFDIACRDAKQAGADAFGWDADGMGALLRDQAAKNFQGTKIHTFMYKGSEGVHDPDSVFDYCENYNIRDQKKNKDVFYNKKAQNIISLAQRIYRTYEAVVLGKYHDPDTLVSFDSEKISPQDMSKLRSEACRMPLKPSDRIAFYRKDELRKGIKQKDGKSIVIPSPNLFDAVVLSFDKASIINHTMVSTRMPKPIRPKGIRR